MRIDQTAHRAVIVNGLIVFHIHGSGAGTHIDHIVTVVEIFYLTDELRRSHLGNRNTSSVAALPQEAFHGIRRQSSGSEIITGLQIQYHKAALYPASVQIPV